MSFQALKVWDLGKGCGLSLVFKVSKVAGLGTGLGNEV